MPYIAPEHLEDYKRRAQLVEALERWVTMVEEAGPEGLDSDGAHHEGYARELGVTLSEFYDVLRLSQKVERVVEVAPIGVRRADTPTREETIERAERVGLVTP